MPYAPGDQVIPGYRLEKFLGRGGFGEVWRAVAPGDVHCAIKIIRLSDRQGIREFRAIRIVRDIRHPNLTPIVQFWLKDDHGHFIQSTDEQDSLVLRGKEVELIIHMGLGDGNLRDRLEECIEQSHQGIPIDELLGYMDDSARGLDFLNQPQRRKDTSGIVDRKKEGTGADVSIQHCDIKPENILLQGNVAQICDFGLARIMNEARRNSQTAGTMAYIAPEILKSNETARTSDQYSFALTFYELRTGLLPFNANNLHQILSAHMEGKLDFSQAGVEEQAVLKRATAMNPEDRYPSCVEMMKDLRRRLQAPRATTSTSQLQIEIDRPAPGDNIGNGYKLKRRIGEGGYGEVWEATGPGNMQAAIKIIRRLERRKGQQEFRALELIKNLEHPYLLVLMAYWLLDSNKGIIPDEQRDNPESPVAHTLVIATKLASKNLLQRLIECQGAQGGQGGIPVPELLKYLKQAADAVDYLNKPQHDLGDRKVAIQHRDIKPENILLTVNGDVRVGDFGLAKIVEGSNAVISNNSMGLTLAYAAPEMFDNRVTAWSDQYSLAITYYHLRTGVRPFTTSALDEILRIHREGKLNLQKLEGAERAVIARATSFQPEQRFQTCSDMVRELEAVLHLASRPAVLSSGEHQRPMMSGGRGGMAIAEGGKGFDLRETRMPEKESANRLSGEGNTARAERGSATEASQSSDLDKVPTVTSEEMQSSATPHPFPAVKPPGLAQPIHASQPSSGVSGRPARQVFTEAPQKKSKLPLALVASLILAIAGIGGGWWWKGRGDGPTKQAGGGGGQQNGGTKPEPENPIAAAAPKELDDLLAASKAKDPVKAKEHLSALLGKLGSMSDSDKATVKSQLNAKSLNLRAMAENGDTRKQFLAYLAELSKIPNEDLKYPILIAELKVHGSASPEAFDPEAFLKAAEGAKAVSPPESTEIAEVVLSAAESYLKPSQLKGPTAAKSRRFLASLIGLLDNSSSEGTELHRLFERSVNELAKNQLQDPAIKLSDPSYQELLPLCKEAAISKKNRASKQTLSLLVELLAMKPSLEKRDRQLAKDAYERAAKDDSSDRYSLYAKGSFLAREPLDKGAASEDQLSGAELFVKAFDEEGLAELPLKQSERRLRAAHFLSAMAEKLLAEKLTDDYANKAFYDAKVAYALEKSPKDLSTMLLAALRRGPRSNEAILDVARAWNQAEWKSLPTQKVEQVGIELSSWLDELAKLSNPPNARLQDVLADSLAPLDAATKSASASPSAFYWLGDYYWLKKENDAKRRDKALTAWGRALKLSPTAALWKRISDHLGLSPADRLRVLNEGLPAYEAVKAESDSLKKIALLDLLDEKVKLERDLFFEEGKAGTNKPKCLVELDQLVAVTPPSEQQWNFRTRGAFICYQVFEKKLAKEDEAANWKSLQKEYYLELAKMLTKEAAWKYQGSDRWYDIIKPILQGSEDQLLTECDAARKKSSSSGTGSVGPLAYPTRKHYAATVSSAAPSA